MTRVLGTRVVFYSAAGRKAPRRPFPFPVSFRNLRCYIQHLPSEPRRNAVIITAVLYIAKIDFWRADPAEWTGRKGGG